jgi:hypothetical protein
LVGQRGLEADVHVVATDGRLAERGNGPREAAVLTSPDRDGTIGEVVLFLLHRPLDTQLEPIGAGADAEQRLGILLVDLRTAGVVVERVLVAKLELVGATADGGGAVAETGSVGLDRLIERRIVVGRIVELQTAVVAPLEKRAWPTATALREASAGPQPAGKNCSSRQNANCRAS